MATAIKIDEYHQEMVETWKCSECNATFPYNFGIAVYCPECGEEFETAESGVGK